jgi:hypothetical protein
VTDLRGDDPDSLGEAMRRLKDVVAKRQRAKPGSRQHTALLEDEEQLIGHLTSLLRSAQRR